MDENIKPRFAIDASFVISFLLPDENAAEVQRFFNEQSLSNIYFYSTQLLPFEVLNTLRMAEVRKRITKHKAAGIVKQFFRLGIYLQNIDFKKAYLASRRRNLTVYDASYFQLALENKIPLLTLDEKLTNLTKRKS